MPTLEEINDLRARQLYGRVVERTAPYRAWLERFESAKQVWNEAMAEHASLVAEMARHEIIPAMLNRVILLENQTVDERAYALYRSAVWCSNRDFTPEQWQGMINQFLERGGCRIGRRSFTPLTRRINPRTNPT